MIGMTWPQYRRRECTYRGRVVRLGRLQAEIVAALLLRRGRIVSSESLIEAIWPEPDRAPENEDGAMRRLLWDLHKRIPWIIFNVHGRGYVIP